MCVNKCMYIHAGWWFVHSLQGTHMSWSVFAVTQVVITLCIQRPNDNFMNHVSIHLRSTSSLNPSELPRLSCVLLQTMKKKIVLFCKWTEICLNTHHYGAGSTSTQIEDKQAEETVTYIIIEHLSWREKSFIRFKWNWVEKLIDDSLNAAIY